MFFMTKKSYGKFPYFPDTGYITISSVPMNKELIHIALTGSQTWAETFPKTQVQILKSELSPTCTSNTITRISQKAVNIN